MGSSDLTSITPPIGFPTAAKSSPSTKNPSYDITHWKTLGACKPSRIPKKKRFTMPCDKAVKLNKSLEVLDVQRA